MKLERLIVPVYQAGDRVKTSLGVGTVTSHIIDENRSLNDYNSSFIEVDLDEPHSELKISKTRIQASIGIDLLDI